jgi:hypothetical protein
MALGPTTQETPLATFLQLLRDVTAVAERCLLSHLLATGDVFSNACGLVCFIIACKRVRDHTTSTDSPPCNGSVYAYRAVFKQWPCMLASQFRLSADVWQYTIIIQITFVRYSKKKQVSFAGSSAVCRFQEILWFWHEGRLVQSLIEFGILPEIS